MSRHFAKEDVQMTKRYLKEKEASLIIRQITVKATLREHLTQRTVSVGQHVQKLAPLYTVVGNAKWC